MSEASDPPDGLHDTFVVHSFIVRMWLEQSEENTGPAIWRGRITHIPGNEHHYFIDTSNIAMFINSYLKEKG